MSKKDTTDNYLRYQIGTIYESMGKYNKAIREYKKLIKKDPLYTQAYIQLGSVYYNKLQDYRTAKLYIEKAYDMEMVTYGSTYYLDIPYLLGMIACKERKKTDAMLYYMDLKSIYTYTTEENKKKADLLKAIRDLN